MAQRSHPPRASHRRQSIGGRFPRSLAALVLLFVGVTTSATAPTLTAQDSPGTSTTTLSAADQDDAIEGAAAVGKGTDPTGGPASTTAPGTTRTGGPSSTIPSGSATGPTRSGTTVGGVSTTGTVQPTRAGTLTHLGTTTVKVPTGPVLWSQPGRSDTQCENGTRTSSGATTTFTLAGPGTPRCEALVSLRTFKEDDDLWFTFETRLAPGFPTRADWQVVAQLKNVGDGSPPVSLAVEQWGTDYVLTGGYGYPGGALPYQVRLGSAAVGSWVSWAMHVRFSTNPSKGSVTVVRDGSVVLDDFHPPGGTLYPARSAAGTNPNGAYAAADYLKFGYYRNSTMTADGSVQHRNWRVIGR